MTTDSARQENAVERIIEREERDGMSENLYQACTCCGRNLYLTGPCEPAADTQSERERLAGTVWKKLQDTLGGPGVDAWACGQVADAIIAAGFGDVAGAKYAIEMRDTARNERDQALIDWAKAENRARAAALERDAALAAMAAAKAEAWEEGAEAMCDEALPYCDAERNPYRKATK